jgi:transketolase
MKENNTSRELISLKKKCIDIRRGILDLTYYGSSSHLGGSLSCVEVLTALFFTIMRIKPDQPDWLERDRMVLSKGHAAPAFYSVMANRGFFPVEELKTFGKSGTRLQKHLDMHKLPGIDASSGSLGQGLSVAAGMALADRMDHKDRFVYVVLGDGELQEGQIWEAALSAAQHKLARLIAFVDCNKMQVDGFTTDIINVEPLVQKWESFGWHAQRIDGSDLAQIIDAVANAKTNTSAPHVIIADTVKGKGIDFMELQVDWHSRALDEDQYQNAMLQLLSVEKNLENEGDKPCSPK